MGDHKIPPVRQRAAERLVGLPAHQHGLSGGHFFEPLEVLRDMPREFPIFPDDPVEGHGCYRAQGHGTLHGYRRADGRIGIVPGSSKSSYWNP